VPTDDGTAIEWDGGEKFYDSPEWMTYLIDHFLKSGAEAQKQILRAERLNARVPELDQFAGFTFDHVLNGIINAQGEDPDDKWRLVVKDNEVSVQTARFIYD
jgi:hypothetical protein